MAYENFTIKQLEDLINGFYGGVFSPTRLPRDLYDATYNRLFDAVERGFGNFPSDDLVLTDMFGNFNHNVGAFSAAKTFQQALDIEKALFVDGFKRPFGEFKEAAGGIFDEYNKNWLKTEYRTAYNNALGARQWLDLKENADIAPLLRYDTAGDERVRKVHEELDGITLHIDHPFWKTNFPPNGWNCRCTVTQYAQDEATETLASKLVGIPEPPKLFALNPAIDKVIFSPTDHPYFNVADRYAVQKAKDFGLPVPPKPKPLKPAPGKQIQRLPFPQRLELTRKKMLASADQFDVEVKEARDAYDSVMNDLSGINGRLDVLSKKFLAGSNAEQVAIKSELEALAAEHGLAVKRMLEAEKNFALPRINHENRVVEILAQDEPLTLGKMSVKGASKASNDFVNRGITAFRRIVGKKNLLNAPPSLKYTNRNGRAFYRGGDMKEGFGSVNLFASNSIETVCHELGHWLEISNLNIINGNVSFFNRRTYGKPIKSLKSMTGLNYRSDEKAVDTDFFNPYMGKICTAGHYETLTMWFTYVLGHPREMREFLAKDPDHFETYLKLFYENL